MRRLIVVATGLNGSPKKWEPLLKRMREEEQLASSDWLIFNHCGFWNFRAFSKCFAKSVETLSLELKARIDEQWHNANSSGQPYDDIICIGHSFGGLIVRQAYLVAAGAYPETVKSHIPWAEKVSRFVLIASTNRGVEPDNIFASILVKLFIATGLLPLLREAVRGSALITNLRITWIRYLSSLKGQSPAMIQLLGTQDGIVKRTDSIDLQQFPNGIQFDISGANHDNIYRPQGNDAEALRNWELRYKLLKYAILQCDPQNPELINSELDKSIAVAPETSATESTTVFILHGIRDTNSGWASQLEDQIKMRGGGNIAVVRSSYGYFSVINFFFPWLRRKNIQWFQDQYSHRFCLNPKANFCFIGHSNGTYILGESLKRISSMKFERVYLAGSVLPCDYPWQDRFNLKQVGKLRNDRSCWDWPVGILCSGLRGLKMKDIGTGGFDGFSFDDERTEEVFYFNGGHGEPLSEQNQPNILAFILDDKSSSPPTLLKFDQVSPAFRLISRMAHYLIPLLLILILIFLYFWARWIFRGFAWDNSGFWLKLTLSILVLYLAYAFAKSG